MKKIITYSLGSTKVDDDSYYPVLLKRETAGKTDKLIGWTMWVGNQFVNRRLKVLTNYSTDSVEENYKNTVFRTTKQAENFYKRHMQSKKGISEWGRE